MDDKPNGVWSNKVSAALMAPIRLSRPAQKALCVVFLGCWLGCWGIAVVIQGSDDEPLYNWMGILFFGAGVGSWFGRPIRGAVICLLICLNIALIIMGLVTWGVIDEYQ